MRIVTGQRLSQETFYDQIVASHLAEPRNCREAGAPQPVADSKTLLFADVRLGKVFLFSDMRDVPVQRLRVSSDLDVRIGNGLPMCDLSDRLVLQCFGS